ncbi:hypothetical protein ACQPXB_46465 [Amycolatopsis sp. CA-161197]|uniref:hypothetical protein n=1 Tax=Amycolatopsis sp. CA-161197 TaxID=3239922 RepID=UPI003D8B916C
MRGEQAWASVRQQHKVRGSAVSAVYSEWQRSVADQKFMARNFRKAECTYSFARPAPDDWERAFAAARTVMAETHKAGERSPWTATHGRPVRFPAGGQFHSQ